MAAHNSLLFCLVWKKKVFLCFRIEHKAVKKLKQRGLWIVSKDVADLGRSTNDLDVKSKPMC